MTCYRCGEPVNDGVSYCPSCGLDLEEAREYLSNDTCPDCEASAENGVCPECGLDVGNAREEVLGDAGRVAAGAADGATGTSASAGSRTEAGGESAATSAKTGGQSGGPDTAQRSSAGGGNGRAGGQGRRGAGDAPTPREAAAEKSTHRDGLSQDEVYCIDCGSIINRRAEMCPDCGMNQVPPGGWEDDGQTRSAVTREDEKLARKDLNTNVLLGIFLPPVAYLNLGKPLLAVLNLVTFNYMLLGFVAVPYHAYAIIRDARERVLEGGGTR